MRPCVPELFELAFLTFKHAKIDAATIDTRRRTGFESRHCQASILKLLSQIDRG
jgi:hypothetical protein